MSPLALGSGPRAAFLFCILLCHLLPSEIFQGCAEPHTQPCPCLVWILRPCEWGALSLSLSPSFRRATLSVLGTTFSMLCPSSNFQHGFTVRSGWCYNLPSHHPLCCSGVLVFLWGAEVHRAVLGASSPQQLFIPADA